MEINYNNKPRYGNHPGNNNNNFLTHYNNYKHTNYKQKCSYINSSRSPNQQLSPSNSYQQPYGCYLNDQNISNSNSKNKKSRYNNYNHNYNYKQNNNKYNNCGNNNNRYYNNKRNTFYNSRFGYSTFRPYNNESGVENKDYSQLPNVVLTKIFSYLNMTDRLNASATCKNWRIGLFNPCLWHDNNLVIYLTDQYQEILKSAYFKSKNISKFTKYITIKYDPNDLMLVEHLCKLLDNLNESSPIPSTTSSFSSSQNFIHLKCISLQPVFNFSNYDDLDYENDQCDFIDVDYFNYDNGTNDKDARKTDEFLYKNLNNLNRSIFKSLIKLCLNSRCIEHLSLGLLNDLSRQNDEDNLQKLIITLNKKHLFNLKSLHISSIYNSSIITLMESNTSNSNNSSNQSDLNDYISRKFYVSNLLCQFINLNLLSINYSDLSHEFLNSAVSLISLKQLNLNVNSLNESTDYDNRITNETWSYVKQRNPSLRVVVNILNLDQSSNDILKLVLQSEMPLKKLRMYFCKSLNPQLIQYISDSYCETLDSLVVVDAITEPTLRYHNPLRYDADPDPLVLLCWKCRYLTELVIVGYEILEINLIAIAKLRSNLKTFYVPMDCIIDLRYGKFKNDDFIEDEDGEDTIVDYGFCSEQVIHKVCKILTNPNWHPLERDELPMCVYDHEMPYEEAYLDTLIKDQCYNN